MTKVMAFVSLLVLNRFKKRLDPRRYNGASFLGLKGIVIKSHGGADSYSFFFAIQTAIEESKNNVLEKIQKQLELEIPLDTSPSKHI
jgi:glycerol-3-phosphate acyltransferase PlsX